MGTTTPQMGLSKPTLNGDAGTWDDQLSASLDRIDLHSHVTGLGVPVPTAGLNINANLTFAGFSAINLKAAAFAEQTAPGSNLSVWVNSANHELYWRNASGTDVRITSGSGLNLSLVGGIQGDYAASGASLYYDDSTETYRFLEAAPLPNDWSRVACGDLDLYEHDVSIATRVRLKSPAALATNYDVTFPAAVPSVAAYVRMSTAGVLSLEGSTTLQLDSLTGSFVGAVGNKDNGWLTWTGTGNAGIPLPLRVGDRITAITVYYSRDSAATITFSLQRNNLNGTSFDSLCSKQIAAGSGAASTEIGTSPTAGSLPQTIATGKAYDFVASCQNTDDVYGISIVYERP